MSERAHLAAWQRPPDSPVTALGSKPLLLLDVDGPLNPYPRFMWPWDGPLTDFDGGQPGSDASGPEHRSAFFDFDEHEVASHGRDDMEGIETVRVRLSVDHGQRLRRLATTYDLVWCTFWEHAANHSIGPLLGLQALHAVAFPTRAIYAARASGSWKTKHLIGWLESSLPSPVPWLWVDDEIDARDEALARRLYPQAPHKAMWVDPHVGLSADDFDAIDAFGQEAAAWMAVPRG